MIYSGKRLASSLICVVLLLSSFLGNVSAAPPTSTYPQSSDSITVTLQAPSYRVTTGEDGFTQVQIEGFDLSGLPGDPALPGKMYNVALPPNVNWDSLAVEPVVTTTVELSGTYEVAPATPAVTWVDGQKIVSWGENADSIVDGKNTKVYQNDAYFPTSYVTNAARSQMRKWRFVRLLFTPVQYNPVTKKLRLATEVELRLTFGYNAAVQDAQVQSELADTVMDDRAAKMLYNYEQAQGWYETSAPTIAANSTADYVIITTSTIVSGSSLLSSFVTHKEERGYTVQVVTESDYSGLTGDSPNGMAEKIRKWLKNNYLTLGIKYVLLIGSPDPDDPTSSDSVGDVPMKMCWPRVNETTYTSYKESPTDYFYADLTGDWNLDDDSYYGEYKTTTANHDYGTGGVDFSPEVYVGRIPVYTGVSGWATTLDSILQKTMDYENSTSLSWRKTALLPMSFSDSSTDGALLANYMKSDYLTGEGFSSYTLYQHKTTGCNSSSSSSANLTDGAVASRWQSNDYGLVTWWGHGDATGAYVGYGSSCTDGSIMETSDVSALDDSYPAIVYQCSCLNGYPESSSNLGYALLKQGAVATVSASRVSWYSIGSWTPSRSYADNAAIGYYLMQQVAAGETVGVALYGQKALMAEDFGSASWMNQMDFNLYGDPSISIEATAVECSDSYETDDTSANAKTITVNGSAKTHNFDVAGDVDWARFLVTSGNVYTITTSDLGASNDTVLGLYSSGDLTTPVEENDNCSSSGLDSCINGWTAPSSGTYYAKATNAISAGGCTGYSYDLAVADNTRGTSTIYLPLMMKESADTQAVENGGFESGSTSWTQPGLYEVIGEFYRRTGSRSAWFGGYDNADDLLYQTVSVPSCASSARLVVYLYVYTSDSTTSANDYFHVELQNSSGSTLEDFLWFNNTMNGSSWYRGTYEWSDFSAHAGRTRRLFFEGTTNSSLYSNFFLDDVYFLISCGGSSSSSASKNGSQNGWVLEETSAPSGSSDVMTRPKER